MSTKSKSRSSEVRVTNRSGIRVEFVVGALLISLLAASCTSDQTDDTPPLDGDEIVEIHVWFGRDGYIPENGFDEFHDAYPNIRVTHEVFSEDDTLEGLVRLSDAGEKMPDIAHTNNVNMGALDGEGLIVDISEQMERWQEEDPDLYNQIHEGVWRDAQADDGRILSFPIFGGIDVLYYRMDWFEEAGFVAPPTTHDELLDVAHAVIEADASRSAMALRGQRGEGASFLIAHSLEIGVPWGADGSGDGPPQLDTDGGRRFLEFYLELADGLVDPGTLSWSFEEQRAAFLTGRSAMLPDGGGIASEMWAAEGSGLEYGIHWSIAGPPVHSDGYIGIDPYAFFVTTDAEHPYEASLVLRYLVWPEVAFHPATTYTSMRTDTVWQHPDFYEVLPWLEGTDVADVIRNARQFPAPPNLGAIEDVLILMWQAMIEDPAQSVDDVIAEWQPQLDAASGG